jgi:hypothetical protein
MFHKSENANTKTNKISKMEAERNAIVDNGIYLVKATKLTHINQVQIAFNKVISNEWEIWSLLSFSLRPKVIP